MASTSSIFYKSKSKPILEWDRYFSIKPSKGNEQTYGERRDYFGYEPSIFAQSPVRESEMARKMRLTYQSPQTKPSKKQRSKSSCGSPVNKGSVKRSSNQASKPGSPRRTLNGEKKWAEYTDKISEYNDVRQHPKVRRYFDN